MDHKNDTYTKEKVSQRELELLISKAIEKIGGRKENDICRYLPVDEGHYMHHFTLRKMKHEAPHIVADMVNKYIVQTHDPKKVPPKPRAARGSRKRRNLPNFSKQDLEKMLHMARMAGDKEMIRKLTPSLTGDLRAIQRELIAAIRQKRVEPDLWNAFVEAATSQSGGSQEPRA